MYSGILASLSARHLPINLLHVAASTATSWRSTWVRSDGTTGASKRRKRKRRGSGTRRKTHELCAVSRETLQLSAGCKREERHPHVHNPMSSTRLTGTGTHHTPKQTPGQSHRWACAYATARGLSYHLGQCTQAPQKHERSDVYIKQHNEMSRLVHPTTSTKCQHVIMRPCRDQVTR